MLHRLVLISAIFFNTCFCDHIPKLSGYRKFSDDEVIKIAKDLDDELKGHAYPRGSARYEFHRPVHNGACHHLKPYLIAVPYNTDDVSIIIQTASKLRLETSVRSGGHSFVCQGIKHNSLHIDVRFLFL